MKKNLSFAFAAIATVLLALPSAAKGQVAFGGTFRGPHGSFSIGVSPFAVGAYVPYPYAEQVYLSPDYGYGFYYDSRWVPARPYGSRWIVAGSPVFYGRPIVRDYAFRYGYSRPFYGRRFVRRDFDGRNFRRFDRRWDGGRRW